MVSSPATATPSTDASWHYHPAEITQTRRFLAVLTRNDAFQDSRSDFDAVPITVLREIPILLRCSLPPIPPYCVLVTISSQACATYADYVTTLLMWEQQDLLVHAMKKPIATSLYQLLQQNMMAPSTIMILLRLVIWH
jgi:hypothetical protein